MKKKIEEIIIENENNPFTLRDAIVQVCKEYCVQLGKPVADYIYEATGKANYTEITKAVWEMIKELEN